MSNPIYTPLGLPVEPAAVPETPVNDTTATTRGARNNNFGNIERTNDQWQGMSPEQTDERFVQFETPEAGVRAQGMVLGSYAQRGLNTIAAIGSEWAPNNENDTAGWINNVSQIAGIDPNKPLEVNDYPRVMQAMARQESGVDAPLELFQAGFDQGGRDRIQQGRSNKEQAVAEAKNRKAMALNPGASNDPVAQAQSLTWEEFRTQNTTIPFDQKLDFYQEIQRRTEAAKPRTSRGATFEDALEFDRSFEDMAKDTGASIMAGFANLGGDIINIADQAQQLIGLNIDLGLGEAADRAVEYWNDQKSSYLQAAYAELGQADGFVETLALVAEHPAIAGDIIAGSLPYLLPSGAAARAYGAMAGMVTGGVLEGSNAGREAAERVEEMTVEELFTQSSFYKEQRQNGVSHDEALRLLQNRTNLTAAAIAMPISVLASKFTGAGKLEASIFKKGATGDLAGQTFTQSLKKTGSTLVKESGEEAIQEGGAKTAQNVAIQANANPDQEISEGVGQAAALGVVAAVGQSGGITAAETTLSAVGKTAQGVKTLGERTAANREAKAAEEAKEREEASKTALDSVDAVVATATAAIAENADPAEALKPVAESHVILQREYDEAIAAVEEALEKGEDAEPLLARVMEISDAQLKLQEVIDANTPETVADIDTATNPEASEEERTTATQNTILRMGSAPQEFTAEQAEALAQSDTVTPAQKAFLQSFGDYKRQVEKNSAEVAQEKVGGTSSRFTGMDVHAANITQAIAAGNREAAFGHLALLEKFTASQVAKYQIKLREKKANPKAHTQGHLDTIAAENKVQTALTKAMEDTVFKAFGDNKVKTAAKKATKNAKAAGKKAAKAATTTAAKVASTTKEAAASISRGIPVGNVSERPDDDDLGPPDVDDAPPIGDLPGQPTTTSSTPAPTQSVVVGESPSTPVLDTSARLEVTATAVEALNNLDFGDPLEAALENAGIGSDVIFNVKTQHLPRVIDGDSSARRSESLKAIQTFYNQVEGAIRATYGQNIPEYLESRGYDVNPILQASLERAENSDRLYVDPDFHNTRELLATAAPIIAENFEANTRKDALLHREENALTKLLNNYRGLKDRMIDVLGLDEAGQKVLDNFLEFAPSNAENLLNRFDTLPVIGKAKSGKTFERSLNDLFKGFVKVNENGSLSVNENLLTTMSAVNYNWLMTDGFGSVFNSEADTLSLLNRDTNESLSTNERASFATAGTPLSTITEELGTQILRALGIRAKDSANEEMLGQLRTSLGAYALDSLIEQGALEQRWVIGTPQEGGDITYKQVTQSDLDNINAVRAKKKQKPVTTPPVGPGQTTMRMARLATTQEHGFTPDPDLLAEQKEFRAAKNFIGDLLSSEVSRDHLYHEPGDIPPYTTDVDGNPLPTKQAEALQKASSEPHEVKHDMVGILRFFRDLGGDFLPKVAGMQDIDGLHQERVGGVTATNDQIAVALENSFEVAEEFPAGTPMFFRHKVVRNGRMHMMGSRFNPQANKIVRHLVKMTAWNTTVDMSVPAQADQFKAAVAEALGFGVDKQNQTKTNEDFEKILNDEAITAAVDAIKRVLAGKGTEADAQAILTALGKKPSVAKLDGLMALSKMDMNTPFESDLFREIDGITNGTAIGLMQYMGAENIMQLEQMLARTGMGLDDAIDSMGDWFANTNNRDSYQAMTAHVVDYVNDPENLVTWSVNQKGEKYQVVTKENGEIAKGAVDFFLDANDPQFVSLNDDGSVENVGGEGRKFSKWALMIANYGAGNARVMEELVNPILESLYKKVEAAAAIQDSDERDVALSAIEKHLADMNPRAKFIGNPVIKFSRVNPLETPINKNVIRNIKEGIRFTYGKGVSQYLDQTYGPMKQRAQYVSHAVGLAWDAFQEMFATREREILANKEGDSPSLTNEEVQTILEELKEFSPIVATALSDLTADGGERTGIHFNDTRKRKMVERAIRNLDELDAKERKHFVKVEFNKSGDRQSSYQYSTYGRKPTHPGANPAVRLIHAIDAATMVELILQYSVMNIHDAEIGNTQETPKITTDMNGNFLDVNSRYSVVRAARDTLANSLEGYQRITGDVNFENLPMMRVYEDGTSQPFINEATEELVLAGDFLEIMNEITELVHQDRMTILPRLKSVLQYNGEGGAHYPNGVLPSTGDEIGDLIDNILNTEMEPAGTLNSIPARLRVMTGEPRIVEPEPTTSPVAETTAEKPAAPKPKAKKPATVQPLTSVTPSPLDSKDDPGATRNDSPLGPLQEALQAGADADKIIEVLLTNRDSSRAGKVRYVLTRAMSQLLVDKPTFVYLTQEQMLKKFGEVSYGGYVSDDHTIYILNPQGANEETVTHELLHAMFSRKLKELQWGGKRTKEDSELLNQLAEIRRVAAVHIKKNPELQARFGGTNATKDIHEIISWGLTNQDFQTMVLDQITVSYRGDNSLISGMRMFIDSIAKAIFGTNSAVLGSETLVSGMDALIRSTGQLLSYQGTLAPRETIPPKKDKEQDFNVWLDAALEAYAPRKAERIVERDALLSLLRDNPDWKPQDAYDARWLELQNGRPNSTKELDAVWAAVNKKAKGGMGSSTGNTRAGQFQNEHQDVTANTSEGIFNDLLKYGTNHDTKEHQDHLRGLLKMVNQNLLNPLKLYRRKTRQNEESSGEVYFDESAIYMAVAKRKQHALEMSPEEIYVHELLHVVLRNGIEGASVAQTELNELYKRAKQFMKPEYFLDDPSQVNDRAAMDAAQARYDYIFNQMGTEYIETNLYNGTQNKLVKTTHLHEFAAIGATNANFRRALSRMDAREPNKALKGMSTADKISEVINRLLRMFSDLVTRRSGQKADAYLIDLLQKLAAVENTQKKTLHRSMSNVADSAVDAINGVVDRTVSGLTTLVESRPVQEGPTPIRAAGAVTEQVLKGNTNQLMRAIKETAKKAGIAHDGIIMSLAREVRGATPNVRKLHRMIMKSNKVIDQTRTKITTSYTKYLNEMFKEEHSAETRAAATRALLSTDFEVLVSKYGLQDAHRMLTDDAFLASQITNVRQSLHRNFNQDYNFYSTMAEGLGFYMAKGRALYRHVLLNAHNIAEMDGTGQSPSGDPEAAAEVIDVLASLYAVKYSNEDDKAFTATMIDKEVDWANPNDPNTSIQAILTSHREMKAQALERTFGGNPTLMQKGYTRETFNPNVEMEVATEEKGKELLALGYEKLDQVKYDPAMPQGSKEPVHYYILREGGGVKYMSGAISTTGKNQAGTQLIGVNEQANVRDPALGAYIDTLNIRRSRQRDIAAIVAGQATRVGVDENITIPVLNENGVVTGYRYTMETETKLKQLERYDDIAHVLGTSFANISDKVNTKALNEELMDMAYETFQEKYRDNPEDFVVLSAKSRNKEYQDQYRMLPSDTRLYAKNLFGGDYIFIHKDHHNLMFGYRAFSVSQLKKQDDPNAKGYKLLKQEMNNAMVKMFNNRMGRKSEAIWQEIIRTVKDSIVIKSVVVTTANIGSNTVLLKMLGVPAKDVIRDQAIAYRGAVKYQKDSFKIFDKEQEIARGVSPARQRQLEQEISELRNELRVNPVRELIEAGVLQTIVDDVNTVEDPFSYKSSLDKAVEPFLSKAPEVLVNAGKTMAVTHDTQFYRVLRDAAQLSDFAARYTLHKYNTQTRKNPMSTQESIDMVVDTFVNYDLPTHKSLQYMNDMGMVMFTKYYLRTQRVILQLAKDKPANLLIAIMAQNLFFDIPDISDSFITETSLLGKFNVDPFDVLTGAAETAPINLVL